MQIVFFGSFQQYSTRIASSLHQHPDITVVAVVTTPPRIAGRQKTLNKTDVHQWSQRNHLPVFTPETLNKNSLNSLLTKYAIRNTKNKSIDLFVSAGYGFKLPKNWLDYPQYGSLNLHFSLLPKFRGGNPAEWALLLGEKTTGVTLITMAEQFDTGHIVAKASVPITPKDTRESLYDKLYTLGSKELPAWLLRHYHWQQKQHFYCQQTLAPTPQSPASPTPYAYMFKRSDGFIPWDSFVKAMTGSPLHPGDFPGRHFQTAVNFLKDHHLLKEPNALAHFIERAVRALHGYPGIWTTIKTPKGKKRLKIHSSHVKKAHLILQTVQLEGQAPSSFNQIKTSLTTNV